MQLAQPPVVYTESVHAELLLRGLPWKATVPEVCLFLLSHGFQCNEGDVALCRDRRRKFNGRCVVRCRTRDEAFAAQRHVHGQNWETRYIEAFVRSRGAHSWSSVPCEDTQFGQAHENPT
jgi:hypothetical protein